MLEPVLVGVQLLTTQLTCCRPKHVPCGQQPLLGPQRANHPGQQTASLMVAQALATSHCSLHMPQ
eukprot:47527-Lingulodinium_polyedra.AAC.1